MTAPRVVAIAAVSSMLMTTACGAPPQTSTSPSTSAVASLSGSGSIVDARLTIAVGSIFGRTGEQRCPSWIDRYDNVVLAQTRLTYTDIELSRMAAAFSNQSVVYSSIDPSLFAVQPGAPTGSIPAQPDPLFLNACVLSMEITNSGSSVIQIPRAGLRLVELPVVNRATYRLVEFCSVEHSSTYCGPGGFGEGGTCSTYNVFVSLSKQPLGSDFLGRPTQTDADTRQPCPEVTLEPNHSVTFRLAAFSAAAMTYHAVPALEVITPSTHGTMTFPDLAAIYTYADPSQFACYRLSGSTFVVWRQGAASYDLPGNAQAAGYCA